MGTLQHPLNLNLHKVISCLQGVLGPAEIDKITAELHRNVRQALRLSEVHLHFAFEAQRCGRGAWRHVVSRGYYCCYCASRAVRLAKSGNFSMEPDDHKRIGELPADFPSKDIWADILTKFRADRNLSDYDHRSGVTQLEYRPQDYLNKAKKFLLDSKKYLKSQGVL